MHGRRLLVQRHRVGLMSIIEPTMHDDSAGGIQYGVRLPDGNVKVYGDQAWVALGDFTREGAHPDGTVVRRRVRVIHGPWVGAGANVDVHVPCSVCTGDAPSWDGHTTGCGRTR